MKRISDFVGKYMAIIVLVVAALALFVPKSCLWIQTSWINYLLMVVMFGMGLTLKFGDFAVVFKRPKDIIIGCIAQFTIMPLLAFALGKIFGLETGLLAGVILVGTCPGGTASNVMTYLSKGDVALSVGMTSVSGCAEHVPFNHQGSYHPHCSGLYHKQILGKVYRKSIRCTSAYFCSCNNTYCCSGCFSQC